MSTRRIYVASLSDYNSGNLHGVWIDTEGKDADELQADVSAMLRESRYPNITVDCPECDGDGCAACNDSGSIPSAEEYAIHDHEGFGRMVEEYTSLSDVAELEETLSECDEPDAFIAYSDHVGGATLSQFQDAYCGEWDSELAYAENLFDECYAHDIPENLRFYIDYEAFQRDLFINDCFSEESETGVYVFNRI